MNDEALIAVKTGNIEKLKELLEQGININAQDASGRTLLHHAASKRQREVVEYLLKNGANVLITTDKNNTALHIAISKYDFIDDDVVVCALLKNVAPKKLRQLLDTKTKASRTAALHVAAKKGCFGNVSLLLQYGANFEISNDAGEKPVNVTSDELIRALLTTINASFEKAKNGDEQLIGYLQKTSIYFISTLYCRNNEGHTIMQVLVSNNHDKLAQDLTSLPLNMATPTLLREFEWTYGRDRVNEMEKLAEQIEKYEVFWLERTDAMKARFRDFEVAYRVGNRMLPSSAEYVTTNVLKICCQILEKAHKVFLAYRQFSEEKSLTTSATMKTVEDVLEILGFDPDQLYIIVGKDTGYYQQLHVEWKKNSLRFVYILEFIIHKSIKYFSINLKTILLIHAINDGNIEKVQRLLDNSVYIKQADSISNNRTVIGYAAEKGNKKIVSLLLKAGVKLMIKSNLKLSAKQGNIIISPVYLATNKGHAQVVKLLLKNVNPKDMAEFIDCQNVVKRTALHAAAKKGHLDIVKILLSYGATYCIFDGKDLTPLDVSTNEDVSAFFKIVDECFHDAKEANVELVQKLKEMQTDELMAVVRTRNCEGHTLAVVAAKANSKHIAAIILRMIKEVKQEKD